MSDIIEELTTPKGAIILLIVIMALVGLFYTDLSGLTKGSIISQSNVMIGQGTDDPISYWVIGFTQSEFATEGFKTLRNDVTVSGKGTTSEEDNVNYDLKADFSLDINSLGYERKLDLDETIPYVSRVYDDVGLFGGISLKHKMSDDGVTYYKFSSETWRYVANYVPIVKITKDGVKKEYKANILETTSTGTRYKVEGTDPVIYYEEAGIMLSNQLEGMPILTSNVQMIPYSSGNELLFVDITKKTLNQILNYPGVSAQNRYTIDGKQYVSWNLAFNGVAPQSLYPMRDYIDYDQNGVFNKEADLRDLDISFDVTDLCTKEFTMPYETWSSEYTHYVASFKTFEYEGISNEDKYSIENEKLLYDVPLVVLGTWHIPVEYGDFTVIELDVIPKIEDAYIKPTTLYDDGGTAKLYVTTSVTGDSGRVIAKIINTDDTKYISFDSETIAKEIDVGTPYTFEFKITSSDAPNDYEGNFKVIVEGTTGIIDSKVINYNIKDTEGLLPSNKVSIIIRAVDKNGNFLNDEYPITVSQTDSTQYGTWRGTVYKDKILISGEETNGLFSQDKIIDVTTNNQEFTLVYAEEGYVPPTNWKSIFLILIAVFAIIGIGYGAYLMSKEK